MIVGDAKEVEEPLRAAGLGEVTVVPADAVARVIVVLGPAGAGRRRGQSAGTAGLIAMAARGAGGSVELVGSVGDDATGDEVVVALGRAGIGHAAVLRDPTADTA